LVVEIQGTEHRLTGTAEAQYHEWRDLLKRLFVSETGFAAEDVNIYMEPEALEPGIELEPETGSAVDPAAPAADGEPEGPAEASGSAEPPEATDAGTTDAGTTDAGATDAAGSSEPAGDSEDAEQTDGEESEAPTRDET